MAPRPPPLAALLLLAALLAPAALGGVVPQGIEVPVLGPPVPRGGVAPAGPGWFQAPGPKVVDGAIDDWVGAATRLGGTAAHDAGEVVYQDFLFDDYGADDGKDALRLGLTAPLTAAEPRAQRLESLSQAFGDEFGLHASDPTGGVVAGEKPYGDAARGGAAAGHADLLEVRVAADAGHVYLLARTTTMLDPSLPALLVLADTDPADAGAARAVPFASGLATERAEVAVLLTRLGAVAADLRTGDLGPVPGAAVALGPAGYANALEAALPRALLEAPGGALRLALGAGVADGPQALRAVASGEGRGQLLNVAFRHEPEVRVRNDRAQALALWAGTIDPFFAELDLGLLARGWTQPWRPTPGHHERVFLSAERLSREQGAEGIHQPYGLYLPTSYAPPRASPLTFWLIWRGGGPHESGAWTPRVEWQLGEARGSLVVTPRERGTANWFVGLGHADFLEVWDDVHRSFAVDPDRVYAAGYSMGGFGAYLLGLLYPDRFAALFPINGPVTQGSWLGLDEKGGLDAQPVNGGDANAQLVYRIVENARSTPFVVFHASNDELVPVTGVARTMARFAELGYRHRLYVFPGSGHYGQAILDEWREAAGYLDRHVRDPDPPRVVYKRVPAMERAVETVASRGVALDFDFDGAYWLRGLEVRDPDPGDPQNHGLADVATRARPGRHAPLGEAGAASPWHTGPYLMTGLRWVPLEPGPAANGFDATLANVGAVRLDLARMGLAADEPVLASVATDGPVALRLAGGWAAPPAVWVDGAPAVPRFAAGEATVALAAGQHTLRVVPSVAP